MGYAGRGQDFMLVQQTLRLAEATRYCKNRDVVWAELVQCALGSVPHKRAGKPFEEAVALWRFRMRVYWSVDEETSKLSLEPAFTLDLLRLGVVIASESQAMTEGEESKASGLVWKEVLKDLMQATEDQIGERTRNETAQDLFERSMRTLRDAFTRQAAVTEVRRLALYGAVLQGARRHGLAPGGLVSKEDNEAGLTAASWGLSAGSAKKLNRWLRILTVNLCEALQPTSESLLTLTSWCSSLGSR